MSSVRGPRVGLLFDSVSENTGDIAIGIAGAQEFARHGIDDVVHIDPFSSDLSDVDMVVVGGGELIRPLGDPFYDAFRLRGGSVLNAAGVWDTAEQLDFLKDYDFVSARNTTEAAVLSRFVDDVKVLPCATTTLEAPHYEIPGALPGEKLIGIHVVPHTLTLCPEIVDQINALEGRKVFIPFTHYNYDASFMSALPFEREDAITLPQLSPLELHSVLGQMDFVVVSSLHASIFAYSQNVPFATVHQPKVLNYFKDRGLERFVFSDVASLAGALTEIQAGEVDFSDLVAKDKAEVAEAFGVYAELAHARASAHGGSLPPYVTQHDDRRESALLVDQLVQVIAGRDRVIAHDWMRLMSLEHHMNRWHAEADKLAAEVATLSARVAGLEEELAAAQLAVTEAESRTAMEHLRWRNYRREP